METDAERKAGRPRSALPDVENPNAFARWLAENDISVEAVSKVLSVSTAAVYGWRRGNRPPRRSMAVRIARMTDGEVPADTWD
jgi:hypothetical protein